LNRFLVRKIRYIGDRIAREEAGGGVKTAFRQGTARIHRRRPLPKQRRALQNKTRE
jgi:hypothetical protein